MEETPITAEEWLKQRSIDNGSNHNWKDPSNDPRTSDLMEQYAQAKLLEALEREVPKAYDAGWKCCLMGDKFEGWDIEHTMETRKKKYYETTVKPKYE